MGTFSGDERRQSGKMDMYIFSYLGLRYGVSLAVSTIVLIVCGVLDLIVSFVNLARTCSGRSARPMSDQPECRY